LVLNNCSDLGEPAIIQGFNNLFAESTILKYLQIKWENSGDSSIILKSN